MADFIQRAVAGAYFSNQDGSVIFDFQFAPHELSFSDKNKFYTRMKVGAYRPEFVWISGDSKQIELNLFIDRTYGSKTREDLGADLSTLPAFRQPSSNPRVIPGQADSYAQSANPPQFDDSNFKQFASRFSPNPKFPQSANDEEIGVYLDYENLRYFLNINLKRVSREDLLRGVIQYEDRFIPPPKALFIYGNLWMSGYIVEVQYNFSAMNKFLVPKRMEAKVMFVVEDDGLLNPVKNTGGGQSPINQIVI